MRKTPVGGGEPIRIPSAQADRRTFPAGWSSTGELWVGRRGSTSPRLVRIELPTGKITRTVDIDLHQTGSYEVWDARITPDESVLAVQYVFRRGRLELMKGIPADR
jgi:hypothetical protein